MFFTRALQGVPAYQVTFPESYYSLVLVTLMGSLVQGEHPVDDINGSPGETSLHLRH
jgi:hypothetical protein